MKLASLTLTFALASLHAFAAGETYINFVRQNQQGTSVVWDMPVAAKGAAPSALSIDTGGSLFQLWTIEQTKTKDYLLDQKLVGAYLPTADIKITTLDPHAAFPRTRVDQPFEVSIEVAGLLTGVGLPDAATKVLMEQHIEKYAQGQISLVPASVQSNTPFSTGYISANGKTVLKFPASSLTASDPTKATGEEHFVVHALSDGSLSQSQIASAYVQVLPIASGSIIGLTPGEQYRYQLPTIQLNLHDLYPRSDSHFMLYEGTQVNGAPGSIVASYPAPDSCSSNIIMVKDLTNKITKDGTYTVALMSTTVYGTELLCNPVTFSVKRSLSVNAMQVNFSE